MIYSELDALWAERHQDALLNAFDNMLRAALDQLPQNTELLWRYARALHFRGLQATEAGSTNVAGELYRDGHMAAEAALALNPDHIPGLFWAASCGIEAARSRGPLASLRTLPITRKRLERVAELDPAFHYAGALRVLGRMAHLTPRFLGGDNSRAIRFYNHALELAPGHPTTMLYLAEALADGRQHAEARNLLEQILAAPTFAGWEWEQERDLGKARELLEQLPT